MGMNPTDLTNENRKYTPAPSVREAKPDWSELPPALTAKIETLIGSNITDAKTAWGGYSNAFSALVQTENHKTYYIKGSHPEQMSHGAKHLAQEVWAYENCAAVQKMAPAFIGTVAEGGTLVGQPNVLANDTDAESDPLTAVPALSPWSMGLLATALMGSACWALRRRDVTQF